MSGFFLSLRIVARPLEGNHLARGRSPLDREVNEFPAQLRSFSLAKAERGEGERNEKREREGEGERKREGETRIPDVHRLPARLLSVKPMMIVTRSPHPTIIPR
jgi:hypothetical protein